MAQDFALPALLFSCARTQLPAMALRVLSLAALLQGVSAIELSEKNWDAETAGKSLACLQVGCLDFNLLGLLQSL